MIVICVHVVVDFAALQSLSYFAFYLIIYVKIVGTDLLKLHPLRHCHQCQIYFCTHIGIVALRRTAEKKGLAQGTVVTKEDFDTHIRRILIPHIKLEDDSASQSVHSGGGGHTAQEQIVKNIKELFHDDLNTAVDRVVDVERVKAEQNQARYNEWLQKKLEEKKEQKLKEVRTVFAMWV